MYFMIQTEYYSENEILHRGWNTTARMKYYSENEILQRVCNFSEVHQEMKLVKRQSGTRAKEGETRTGQVPNEKRPTTFKLHIYTKANNLLFKF